jgi:hypothetical protein
MVRVFVDDDLVGVPEPAVTEGDVGCSDIPIPAVEPEASGVTAGEPPNMGASKSTGEAAVGERLIDVVVGIIGSRVVTDPDLTVDVRHVGVAGLIREGARLLLLGCTGLLGVARLLWRAGLWRGFRRSRPEGRRATGRNSLMLPVLLGKRGDGKDEQCGQS